MSDPFNNLVPLRGDPAALKPRAKAILDHARHAADVKARLERPYIIKGWLDRGGLSVIYGESNVGKSFLGVDIAHHVSKGLPWGKRRVRKGRVLYVAAEGGATFDNRIAALDNPEMWIISRAMLMTGRDSQAFALAEVIQHLAYTGGEPFDLIIFDTMSRVMGAGDENTAPGIAELLDGIDHLRRATGAHVMLIHHSGKDKSQGLRGHSSMRAAVDTEIRLTREDELSLITAEVTKQRDGPTGYKFAYTLRLVHLGDDQDGDQVTTCVVAEYAA